MSNPVLLLLRLEGPLQSWGVRSRWDVRDSGDEPTKSGLVGLLGCALGYSIGDPRLLALDQGLTLGVRVERFGKALTDFQTISGVLSQANGARRGTIHDPATIVSPRTYLQDAAFLAVFSGEESLIRRCADALMAPRWPTYLGRKSCPPSRPVLDCVARDYSSCEDALRSHPWDWEGRVADSELPTRLRCTLEDIRGTWLRRDRLLLNPARMYGTRRVRVFWTDFPGVKEESVCTCQD